MQLPRPHPADRALVRGQVIAVVLLAAGYAAPWVLLARAWGFPVWWAASGALGAAIVAVGIALLARTHGEQLARRELEEHRRRQAARLEEGFDPGAAGVERVDQVLAAAPAPPGSPEEAVAAVLDSVGPGGLPRAAIADRLEERGVLVRPEDLSVLLGRLVAAGAIRLTSDGWYVSESEAARVRVTPDPTLGGARVDLRRRGRYPTRPGDRAAWAMILSEDLVDRSPAGAAADAPADLELPAAVSPAGAPLADLVVDAVRATREDGIAGRTLRERLTAQGHAVNADELDALLAELVGAGRLVKVSSWGRYRHPDHVRS